MHRIWEIVVQPRFVSLSYLSIYGVQVVHTRCCCPAYSGSMCLRSLVRRSSKGYTGRQANATLVRGMAWWDYVKAPRLLGCTPGQPGVSLYETDTLRMSATLRASTTVVG